MRENAPQGFFACLDTVLPFMLVVFVFFAHCRAHSLSCLVLSCLCLCPKLARNIGEERREERGVWATLEGGVVAPFFGQSKIRSGEGCGGGGRAIVVVRSVFE